MTLDEADDRYRKSDGKRRTRIHLSSRRNQGVSCPEPRRIQLIGSEITVLGHTSRPSGYVVKRYEDPSDENSAFLPDEVFENDFKHGGLGYEADAFARTLKGESIA